MSEASASRPAPIAFVFPGDWQTATGGYAYDRRIVAGLRERGRSVTLLSLPGAYPQPDAATLAQAAERIAALPDGTCAVVDGLAFGALPELAHHEAGRLEWIALVHHPLWREFGSTGPERDAAFERERRALAVARRVIATSAATARDLRGMGVDPERLRIVEPGTDASPQAAGSAGPDVALLCVATLTPRKGHLLLIEALAGLRDRAWTLDCVGSDARDATAAARVRAALAAHDLGERVRLHGEVGATELEALYHRADAFVLASWHEGYGMAPAEALARGLPVLATAAGALADWLPPCAAMTVPCGDVAALRGALARFIDDAAWRASLREGARRARDALPIWPEAVSRFEDALAGVAP